MYFKTWWFAADHISSDRMRSDIDEFFEYSRWSSFDKLNGLARLIVMKMQSIGMEDARLIELPADGETAYCGWKMPKAYDVVAARLEEVGNSAGVRLADYHDNPTSLMLYSLSTPAGGIEAELVTADSPDAMKSEHVHGKLVLTRGIGIEYSRAAMQAGAVGLVSDCRNTHRTFKTGGAVDETNEWHNYTIPPWDEPGKGFGFSISPKVGERLRQRIADGETIILHAYVETRQYDGVLPVISGRLPGRILDEIVITGHFDEFGADDNCSQIAVALEAIRVIKALIADGVIGPLERSVRILLPMEVRGFNALIQDPTETNHIRAGLNIDTVGTDQNLATSTCTLSDNFNASPTYADTFAAKLMDITCSDNPLFRWRRTQAEMIDNIFAEPLIGAPMPQIWHFSATHHLATDTPDRISSTMLHEMARLTAAYCAFLATAGISEAIWLADLCGDEAERHFVDVAAHNSNPTTGLSAAYSRSYLGDAYGKAILNAQSAASLVPSDFVMPVAPVSDAERTKFAGPMHLLPKERFALYISDTLAPRLEHAREEAKERIPEVSDDLGSAALESLNSLALPSTCVPLKIVPGFLGFEDLSEAELNTVYDELKIERGWGAPMWLQDALMFANGKRTAGEIANRIPFHRGSTDEVRRLESIFRFLADRNIVRLRPYISREELKAALSQTGIERGDTLLGHFALNWFGYIEGGTAAILEILRELLGPGGTLMMPTFTFSWLGRMPYKAERTPSLVGAITEAFRKMPGVQRSAHPTHAFAAVGRYASELLADHDHTKSPLSEDSPIARLERLNGKILMFAPPQSNTSMHLGERRAGMPLLDFVCPLMVDRVRQEVVVPDCPWHVRFDHAYELLVKGGRITETPLGENTIRTMLCSDAVAAQAEVMRTRPRELLQPGCDCPFCVRLKSHCDDLGL